MKTNRIAALGAALALTVSLGACTVQVGGPDEESTPAPTQSEETVNVNQELMQQAWDGLSYSEQQTICQLGSDFAAESFFGEVAKGDNPTGLTLAEAQEFFAGVC